MDFVSWLIEIARVIGSFLCFQRSEATFHVDTQYFPVCSGCFGIYFGSLIALSIFPFFRIWSRRLYSLKCGLVIVLPMVIYWAILNIESTTGMWIVPGINELYFLTGFLLGAAIGNAVFNLNLETQHVNAIRKTGERFWIVPTLLLAASSGVFWLYPTGIAAVFVASMVFLLGLFSLVGFIAVWLFSSITSHFGSKKPASDGNLVSVLTILIVLVSFMFFQILIFEEKIELIVLGLLLGAFAFGVLGRSLRTLTFGELGFVKNDWRRQIAYGILVGFILYGSFAVYRFVFFNQVPLFGMSFDYVGFLVVFAIVVSEEFFFRGYTISLLRRHMNTASACVLSSVFFAFYHLSSLLKTLIGLDSAGFIFNVESFMLQFLGGLLLSYFFVKKKSLLMPVTVHFVWNLLVFAGASFETLPILP